MKLSFTGDVTMDMESKQQRRTRETQARLLAAAEEVFVREGYEVAQLDAIAAAAGRSKGAVYAHFKSKEDLFLALFEHRTRSYVGQFVGKVKKCTTRSQSMTAFREFYVGLADDTTWPILTLEFKLFALRHPESKERLRKAFEMSKATGDASIEKQVFGELTRDQRAEREVSLAVLGPIVSGLILESNFEPKVLSARAIRRVLGRIFDTLFPPTGRSRGSKKGA
jgi:AcrR family transcriptional regulator